MSRTFDDSNRQIIPRWYPFKMACQLGDIEPERAFNKPKVESLDAFNQKVNEWREVRSIYNAIDVVGSALIMGDYLNPYSIDAAAFILSSGEPLYSLARQIAEAFNKYRNSEPENERRFLTNNLQHKLEIKSIKVFVRSYPRNAIAWSDLAYHYTLLGQKDRAQQCMEIAVSLGSENRFILRSAARCFLHLDQPEKALFYIRRSLLSHIDPWLVSSEIAIAEGIGTKTKLVKQGQAMIYNQDLSPWSINELAATISTMEARSGSVRKSKKLLVQALQWPNENTMAQAEWLAPGLGKELIRPQKQILAPYEADSRRSFREGDFDEALKQTKDWFRFQPFTSRPAILASYIAAVCCQNDMEAIEIIEKAKTTSPESFLLHNNHAFSLASLGRLEEASEILDRVNKSTLTDIYKNTLAATIGLLEFRKDNFSEGRRLYKTAITGFKNLNEYPSAAIASFFLAREENRIHSEFGNVALDEAKSLAEKYGVKEIVKYAKKLGSSK